MCIRDRCRRARKRPPCWQSRRSPAWRPVSCEIGGTASYSSTRRYRDTLRSLRGALDVRLLMEPATVGGPETVRWRAAPSALRNKVRQAPPPAHPVIATVISQFPGSAGRTTPYATPTESASVSSISAGPCACEWTSKMGKYSPIKRKIAKPAATIESVTATSLHRGM